MKKRNELFDLMTDLSKSRQYASAKNLAEWCRAVWPEEFELNDRDSCCYHNWLLADAAKYLGDFCFGADLAGKLARANPGYFTDIVQGLLEYCERGMTEEARGPFIHCDDKRLAPIMKRLGCVFHAIDKPVSVFVAESKEHYEKFHTETFPGVDIYPYESFQASGFHTSPASEWLVFKKCVLEQCTSDEELTGLCAHEMAHLDLIAKKIHGEYFQNGVLSYVDMNTSERMTDLYVLTKGLAYSLYCYRQRCGASDFVMSSDEIEQYVRKIRKQAR